MNPSVIICFWLIAIGFVLLIIDVVLKNVKNFLRWKTFLKEELFVAGMTEQLNLLEKYAHSNVISLFKEVDMLHHRLANHSDKIKKINNLLQIDGKALAGLSSNMVDSDKIKHVPRFSNEHLLGIPLKVFIVQTDDRFKLRLEKFYQDTTDEVFRSAEEIQLTTDEAGRLFHRLDIQIELVKA